MCFQLSMLFGLSAELRAVKVCEILAKLITQKLILEISRAAMVTLLLRNLIKKQSRWSAFQ